MEDSKKYATCFSPNINNLVSFGYMTSEYWENKNKNGKFVIHLLYTMKSVCWYRIDWRLTVLPGIEKKPALLSYPVAK